jgi:hypothetical protein
MLCSRAWFLTVEVANDFLSNNHASSGPEQKVIKVFLDTFLVSRDYAKSCLCRINASSVKQKLRSAIISFHSSTAVDCSGLYVIWWQTGREVFSGSSEKRYEISPRLRNGLSSPQHPTQRAMLCSIG